MIKVSFRTPRTREWRNWRRACDAALLALKARKGPPYVINEMLYKQIREWLLNAYSNKCAYCEGRLYEQSAALVEHFRPKGSVRDLDNTPIKVGPQMHSGYWWLAYDPSNLLPACSMCNVYTRSRGGKGERFPLPKDGFRATKPGEEKKEKPLLIHPGREDPSMYFDLDFETGALKARDERGRVCIEVFGLNREALLEARKYAAREATLYIRYCRKGSVAKVDQERIDDHVAGRKPYSFVWRKVREDMSSKCFAQRAKSRNALRKRDSRINPA